MGILKSKRSAVPNKAPSVADIALGDEIAINTHDGKLYIKKDDGTQSVVGFSSDGPPAGIKSNGQNVILASKTLGEADKGTNILILTSGITLTFPATGFASGEGFAISNVSGGTVTLAFGFAGDFGTSLPNGGSFFAFSDGAGYWRQYCYSTARL